jgi:glutaminyl-peptide cyclotransferase
VLSVRPHDPEAFTQGLLLHEGSFYESTGQYGESDLREVDPQTGEVLRLVPLDETYFGEGLARVDDRLYQITWREGEAFVYDMETFERLQTFTYEGDGWGLCYDGQQLYMTDGGPTLYVRDPATFEIINQLPITLRGEPLARANELECVGDHIYANVWQTEIIVRIDKSNGVVDTVIDASGLLSEEERAANPAIDVLNGIAYDEANDVFYITGKNWPTLYEVRFVEP